jgi:membrane associated rhomboid family serine protease
VFGDDIEEALGRGRFLVFYLLCGIIGAAIFVWSDPHAQVTLIGASGAISGIVIAYVMLRPCAKVTFLVGIIPLRVRAYWIVGAFVLLQFINLGSSSKSEVAYWCHIGGMAAGAILLLLMRPPGVLLFECMRAPKVPIGAAGGDGAAPGG